METVLIAGGAGFIGSHLSESLLDEGYNSKTTCICIKKAIDYFRKA